MSKNESNELYKKPSGIFRRSVEQLMKRIKILEDIFAEEDCPHCGYYCNGKSVFCTKHPDGPCKNLTKDKKEG